MFHGQSSNSNLEKSSSCSTYLIQRAAATGAASAPTCPPDTTAVQIHLVLISNSSSTQGIGKSASSTAHDELSREQRV